MKSYILSSLVAILALAFLFFVPVVVDRVSAFFESIGKSIKSLSSVTGMRLKQGGFVTLLRPYAGYQAGQVVELPNATETALIASGGATTSAGPATSGALSCSVTAGAGTFAAAAASVTITNPLVTPQSSIWACLNQAGADTTLLYIARIVPAQGSFTVYGNAAATAATGFDWAILYQGTLSNP